MQGQTLKNIEEAIDETGIHMAKAKSKLEDAEDENKGSRKVSLNIHRKCVASLP